MSSSSTRTVAGQVCAFGSHQSRGGKAATSFCETNPILSPAIEAALRATLKALLSSTVAYQVCVFEKGRTRSESDGSSSRLPIYVVRSLCASTGSQPRIVSLWGI
jgi:hypothetical protein